MAEIKKPGLPPMMVRRIMTLQGLSGISEEEYRSLLWGYEVESCKDLTIADARKVIDFLQGLAGKVPEKRPVHKRYDDLGRRSGEMATPKQLRMLEAMWMDVTSQKNRVNALEAYQVFLHNRFRILVPEHIEKDQVGKIKMALEAMRVQRAK
jgi:hypothetical protein